MCLQRMCFSRIKYRKRQSNYRGSNSKVEVANISSYFRLELPNDSPRVLSVPCPFQHDIVLLRPLFSVWEMLLAVVARHAWIHIIRNNTVCRLHYLFNNTVCRLHCL